MYQKRKNKKIIIILIICFIIGIISIIYKERQLTVFEKAIKDSVLTVEKIVTYPINYIIDKININNQKKDLYNKYIELLSKYDEIKMKELENEELKKEINELQSILNIDNVLSGYSFLNASVISRDLVSFNETLTVDKGEESGVVIDSPVVVGNGLIGKVVKTTSFTSTIRLLTANNSNDKISVKIKTNDEYIFGILNGYDITTDTYTISALSSSREILTGDVTTTGMGDIFPSGIMIGKIVGYETDNFDLSLILKMKSDVDFNDINYVKILKRNCLKWLSLYQCFLLF